jgi:hypothetical protein
MHNQSLVFSADDLVNFLGCRHATFFDRRNLDAPMEFGPEAPLLALLQAKGLAHERRYLDELRNLGRSVVEIAARGSLTDRHFHPSRIDQDQRSLRANLGRTAICGDSTLALGKAEVEVCCT